VCGEQVAAEGDAGEELGAFADAVADAGAQVQAELGRRGIPGR
jgi:hypothetical protein